MATTKPRPPVCTAHHVWMAACPDCRAVHEHEQAQALARLSLIADGRRPR